MLKIQSLIENWVSDSKSFQGKRKKKPHVGQTPEEEFSVDEKKAGPAVEDSPELTSIKVRQFTGEEFLKLRTLVDEPLEVSEKNSQKKAS